MLGVWCGIPMSVRAVLVTEELRCESLANPLGIDVAAPRLSWQFQASREEKDKSQSAWQIIAASSLDTLARDTGDLWDSGKVVS
jgi:alpha-L-rhamnosidase